jgi:hypothetical protein
MRTLKEIPVGTKFMFLYDVNDEIYNSYPPIYINMPKNQLFYVNCAEVFDSNTVIKYLDWKVVVITA